MIGALEIVASLFLLAGRWLLRHMMGASGPPIQALTYLQVGAAIAIGAATLWLSRTALGARRPRLIAVASAWFLTSSMVWGWLLIANKFPGSDRYIPGVVIVFLLVTTAALPLRPLQTLAFGVGFEIFTIASWRAAVLWGITGGAGWDALHQLFTFMVVLLCTALSAVVYAERRGEHEAHMSALRAAEALSAAQSRVLLAENTASLGRLAAGLMHELNSPIGVLASGVDTLIALGRKQAAASPEQQKSLLGVQSELHRSLSDSVGRLQRIITRVRNLVNLDEAELLPTDLNELLSGTVGLHNAYARSRGIEISFESDRLPVINCRPQQIGAVLNVLMNNCLQAIETEGIINVSARSSGSAVTIRFADSGRGISPEELAGIFQPNFTVKAGRVEARNWGLFSARQIVLSHGGEIRIESQPGRGTTVTLTLPA